MLKIKLSPRGKKHQTTYRIRVMEARSKLNGRFVDDLGFYTPQTQTLKIDQTKLKSWQQKGAQLTLGLKRLLWPDKFLPKAKKSKKGKKKAPTHPTPPSGETKNKLQDQNKTKPKENNASPKAQNK